MLNVVAQGLIFGLVALGVFLTYKVLAFADLTVDGSFTCGAATAAMAIYVLDLPPLLATGMGVVAGALAGLLTGLLHTGLKIDPLLASILVMIGLYSINLRIMGSPNIQLNLREGERVTTLFSYFKNNQLWDSWQLVAVTAVVALVLKFFVDWYLATDFGLTVQATGDNATMASAQGVSTNATKIITLMVSNGLVGLGGGLYAQFNGSADAQMGVGMILVGLASVIIGSAVFPSRRVVWATLGVVVGSVLYRLVIYWALLLPGFRAQDMKVISAVLVVLALIFSQNKALRSSFAKLSPHRQRAKRAQSDAGSRPTQEVGA
ncbi:MAG: ABC transporter permease [Micrococcales bacterium]|nr:ABC transporter permease [Micrococcales bacterium]